MSTSNVHDEIDELIEAYEHGAGEGRTLAEFLGMTPEEVLLYRTVGSVRRGYVPPVRIGVTRRAPLRPIDAPDSESIADHYRNFDPRWPMAALILTLLGGGCALALVLWALGGGK